MSFIWAQLIIATKVTTIQLFLKQIYNLPQKSYNCIKKLILSLLGDFSDNTDIAKDQNIDISSKGYGTYPLLKTSLPFKIHCHVVGSGIRDLRKHLILCNCHVVVRKNLPFYRYIRFHL